MFLHNCLKREVIEKYRFTKSVSLTEYIFINFITRLMFTYNFSCSYGTSRYYVL